MAGSARALRGDFWEQPAPFGVCGVSVVVADVIVVVVVVVVVDVVVDVVVAVAVVVVEWDMDERANRAATIRLWNKSGASGAPAECLTLLSEAVEEVGEAASSRP